MVSNISTIPFLLSFLATIGATVWFVLRRGEKPAIAWVLLVLAWLIPVIGPFVLLLYLGITPVPLRTGGNA